MRVPPGQGQRAFTVLLRLHLLATTALNQGRSALNRAHCKTYRIAKVTPKALTWRAIVDGVVHVHLGVDTHLLQLVVDVSCAAVEGQRVSSADVAVNRIIPRQVIGSSSVFALG